MAAHHSELLEPLNYQQIKKNFTSELSKAAQGQSSSISFIKHQLPEKPIITQGIVQGIVIGGTNYIVSTEQIVENEHNIVLDRKTGVLPTFATRQILIDFLNAHLDERAEAIGINFGFPLTPYRDSHGKIDSKLLKGTKEHTFTGLVEPLGQLAQQLFIDNFNKTIPVAVANDTICLSLAGKATQQGSVIVGTGFNMAVRYQDDQQMYIVNLESGNFNKFDQSDILKQLDDHSEKPGEQLFEKMISGKYLSQLFNLRSKELGLTSPQLLSSQELSALCNKSLDKTAMKLAREIIVQSASLVASAVAGMYTFAQKPKTFELVGEGSLLWNGWQYQETIKKQLKNFDIPDGTITIRHIPHASIHGAIGLLTS